MTPDCKHIILGREDGIIRVFDIESRKYVQEELGKRMVVSPDFKFMASIFEETITRTWLNTYVSNANQTDLAYLQQETSIGKNSMQKISLIIEK